MLLTHKLDEQLGTNWCQQHGVFFADDTRMRWNIESLQELGQACAQASKALGILESNGLVLSRERQSVYCALTAHKRQLRCGRSCTRPKTKLQWSGEYLLPLQTTHVYLGGVVSYFDFEFQNAKHRAHAGQVTFQSELSPSSVVWPCGRAPSYRVCFTLSPLQVLIAGAMI